MKANTKYVLLLSRPVIGNIVFLNFLSYMICLWHVCSAIARRGYDTSYYENRMERYSLFPSKVSRKAEDRNEQKNEIEDAVGPKAGDNSTILGRKSDRGRNNSV